MLLEIVGRPRWWAVLLLIPFVNIAIVLFLSIDLAKAFGKPAVYAVGIFCLPFIFLYLLGLDESRYVEPPARRQFDDEY